MRSLKSSELFEILNSGEELGALRNAISPAMPAYRAGLAVRGRTARIFIETEGKEFSIAEVHVQTVCEEYLAGRLDEEEVTYVMTALELCPDFRFVSEAIEEAVSLLSDSVANGPLSREIVETILRHR